MSVAWTNQTPPAADVDAMTTREDQHGGSLGDSLRHVAGALVIYVVTPLLWVAFVAWVAGRSLGAW